MKTCITCHEEKPDEEFPRCGFCSDTNKPKRRPRCNVCHYPWERRQREKSTGRPPIVLEDPAAVWLTRRMA